MVKVARDAGIVFKTKEWILSFLSLLYLFFMSLFAFAPKEVRKDGYRPFRYSSSGGSIGGSGQNGGGKGPNNRPSGSSHTLMMGACK